MAEAFFPSQQFGINLGEFLQLVLKVTVVFDGIASRLLLGLALEEEFVDLAHRQTLSQVVKRPMFIPTMVAVAVGFTTPGEALHQRSA
jgi:hypothetical protein